MCRGLEVSPLESDFYVSSIIPIGTVLHRYRGMFLVTLYDTTRMRKNKERGEGVRGEEGA